MANIKQQKKRIRQDEKQRLRNLSVRSRMKTMMGYALTAIDAGEQEKMQDAVNNAISAIDRAASKGVIHQNTAARKKASLVKRARTVSA
jgi:small subunit ribosomal protein S20